MKNDLLRSIDEHIKEISDRIHRLKREHDALKDVRLPLSMGVLSESEAAARLYGKGITIYQEAL